MLLKWIQCQVSDLHHDAFSTAQEAWRGIATEPGFLGQYGGWADAHTACILGLWESAAAQQRFLLEGSHDSIVAANQQMHYMENWSTSLLEQVFPMPGEASDLAVALADAPAGAYLRIADCHIPLTQQPSFLIAQESIWLPAMRDASGMLGGGFYSDAGDHFLVATLWESADHHQRYQTEDLPGLRAQVQALQALPSSMSGYAIQLHPSWTVKAG
ncbi:MAG: DUF4937 domain-containing protein [Planctomycetota bacterium]